MKPAENTELRYAVAVALGWKFYEGSFNGHQKVTYPGVIEQWGTTRDIPHYDTDLNAMHEAEATLDEGKLWFMSAKLADIVPAETPIAHANATERAKAFLESCDKFLGEDE